MNSPRNVLLKEELELEINGLDIISSGVDAGAGCF